LHSWCATERESSLSAREIGALQECRRRTKKLATSPLISRAAVTPAQLAQPNQPTTPPPLNENQAVTASTVLLLSLSHRDNRNYYYECFSSARFWPMQCSHCSGIGDGARVTRCDGGQHFYFALSILSFKVNKPKLFAGRRSFAE